MTVLEYARQRLRESEYQASLGNTYALSDVGYWTHYIEGAEAQQKEFQKELGFMISRIPPELKSSLQYVLDTLDEIKAYLTADLISIPDKRCHAALDIAYKIKAIYTAQEVIRFFLSKEESMDFCGQKPEPEGQS